MKTSIGLTLFALINMISMASCTPSNNSAEMDAATETSFAGDPTKRASITDRSLNMVSGTFEMPSSWSFRHNIASNTQGGGYLQYDKEFKGPNGEMMIGLGIGTYSQWTSQGFQQPLYQLIYQKVGPYVRNLQLGQVTRSQFYAQTKAFAKGRQIMPNGQALEVEMRGDGVVGKVFVFLAEQGGSGVFIGDAVFAPSASFNSAINCFAMVANTFQENPQYTQRIQQISQRNMQASAQQHQQRMAMRQQSFQAHQNRMKQNSAMMDQQHQAWRQNFNAPSTYNASSGYSSHDAYNDVISERTTFNDPYTGHEVKKDGWYDHNYTNGLGDYHRTNDPSFDPASLQGNWQRIEPLGPGNN